jgi:hypothetical protein
MLPLTGFRLAAFLVVVAAAMALMLYFAVRPGILEGRRIDRVCSLMLLKRAKATDSIWKAQQEIGNQFGVLTMGAPPVAQGERNGVPVQVQFHPDLGEHSEEKATSVMVVWPRVVSAGVSFDRVAPRGEPTKLVKMFPLLARAAAASPFRYIDRPWFGRADVSGSDVELERVFNPRIRALLDTFPRRLAVVTFVDRVLILQWFGLEDDLTVIEQAFQLGAKCLELLAPRA